MKEKLEVEPITETRLFKQSTIKKLLSHSEHLATAMSESENITEPTEEALKENEEDRESMNKKQRREFFRDHSKALKELGYNTIGSFINLGDDDIKSVVNKIEAIKNTDTNVIDDTSAKINDLNESPEKKEDLTEEDLKGLTALYSIEYLVKNGVDPNEIIDHVSALQILGQIRDFNAGRSSIPILLEAGADVDKLISKLSGREIGAYMEDFLSAGVDPQKLIPLVPPKAILLKYEELRKAGMSEQELDKLLADANIDKKCRHLVAK